MNAKFMALAKEGLHRVLRQMTVTRTHVHHQRTLTAGDPGQWLSKARIDRLTNQMFDDGTMRCWGCN